MYLRLPRGRVFRSGALLSLLKVSQAPCQPVQLNALNSPMLLVGNGPHNLSPLVLREPQAPTVFLYLNNRAKEEVDSKILPTLNALRRQTIWNQSPLLMRIE